MMMAESATGEPRLTGQVIFHSQQAIEKYLKSYLVEKNVYFPKTHDLPTLYELVKKITDCNIDEIMLEQISNIYTATRYPNNIGLLPGAQVPTVEKSKEVYDFAKNLERLIKKELGV